MSIQDLQHVAYVQITDSMLDDGLPYSNISFTRCRLNGKVRMWVEDQFEDGITHWVEVE